MTKYLIFQRIAYKTPFSTDKSSKLAKKGCNDANLSSERTLIHYVTGYFELSLAITLNKGLKVSFWAVTWPQGEPL